MTVVEGETFSPSSFSRTAIEPQQPGEDGLMYPFFVVIPPIWDDQTSYELNIHVNPFAIGICDVAHLGHQESQSNMAIRWGIAKWVLVLQESKT